jgi:hypothetical protein
MWRNLFLLFCSSTKTLKFMKTKEKRNICVLHIRKENGEKENRSINDKRDKKICLFIVSWILWEKWGVICRLSSC